MTKLNKLEIEATNKFIQNFVDSAVKTLSHNLDKDVYKKIEFFINSSAEIKTLNEFKNSNILYKLDYSEGIGASRLGVLVPEELISSISDVLMGGAGEGPYSGSLTELELNAAGDLGKKIFGDIENTFKRFYTKDFGLSTTPLILTKEMPRYDEEFESSEFDFLIDQTFRINEEKEYTIALLLKSTDLKKTLTSLEILRGGTSEKNNFRTNIDIGQLSDVKIDITAELGSTRIPVKSALELVRGSLVRLDTLNNSDIKVFANDIEVARAQVVAVGDNFGLKITKIISPEERIKIV